MLSSCVTGPVSFGARGGIKEAENRRPLDASPPIDDKLATTFSPSSQAQAAMADAAAIDAEAKKRAKRERLEAWRREQAKKKRQVSGDDDASSKKAKVSDTPTPPAGKFATTLGFLSLIHI